MNSTHSLHLSESPPNTTSRFRSRSCSPKHLEPSLRPTPADTPYNIFQALFFFDPNIFQDAQPLLQFIPPNPRLPKRTTLRQPTAISTQHNPIETPKLKPQANPMVTAIRINPLSLQPFPPAPKNRQTPTIPGLDFPPSIPRTDSRQTTNNPDDHFTGFFPQIETRSNDFYVGTPLETQIERRIQQSLYDPSLQQQQHHHHHHH